MFINFSNHPGSEWGKEEIEEAKRLGGAVHDMPFPQIPPDIDSDEMKKLAAEYASKIAQLRPSVVNIQGEYTFTYNVVKDLKARGVCCVAACSERHVEIEVLPDCTRKRAIFRFVHFREY